MPQHLINHYQISNIEALYDAIGNGIINGQMDLWQRGATSSSTKFIFSTGDSGYTADRFYINNQNVSSGSFDCYRGDVIGLTGTNAIIAGHPVYSAYIETGSTKTVLANTDYATFGQIIEGYTARNFYGRPCTLSFWVRTNYPNTGTRSAERFSVRIRVFGSTHKYYISEYQMNASSVWQHIKIPLIMEVPDAVVSDNYTFGRGIGIDWAFDAGTSQKTSTLNTWSTTNRVASTNQTNLVSSGTNDFYITSVQLRLGTHTEDNIPFLPRRFSEEVLLCQRYYEKTYNISTNPGSTNTHGYIRWEGNYGGGTSETTSGENATFVRFSTRKRDIPVVETYDLAGNSGYLSYTNINAVLTKILSGVGEGGFHIEHPSLLYTTVGTNDVNCHWTADAEIPIT